MADLSPLRQRVVSAAVLLPVAVAAVWLGGWAYAGLVIVAGALMAWEWARMVYGRPWGVEMALLAGAVVSTGVAAMIVPVAYVFVLATVFWGAAVAFAALARRDLVWHLLATPYICLPIVALILLRRDPDLGLAVILWLFCVIWATDICAYFTGRTLGGPKLAPRASPNKTWSGLAGGVVGAAAVGVATAMILGQGSVVALAAFSGALAVAGQGGDIAESAIKRRFGVKDSSKLIPGHGGVMDRVDGLVAAAVVALAVGWLRSGGQSAAHGALVW
jgi:phosphatidate cytidylyltransferase